MERLYRNISPVKSALEKRPKVFNSVRVNLSVNILFSMIDNLVSKIILQSAVRAKRISVDRRALLNMAVDFALKVSALSSRNDHSSHLAVTLKQAHHGNLACSLISSG